jgi:holo-[acyl-carrier protein] synthase
VIVGVGIDLVDIVRIERLIEGKGSRALTRLFTEREVLYAMSRARPAMHLAARVAAKEAAFKALAGSDDARLIGWREVEVISNPHGPPVLAFHGRADLRAREIGVYRTHLSLTHTDTAAGAVVILEQG